MTNTSSNEEKKKEKVFESPLYMGSKNSFSKVMNTVGLADFYKANKPHKKKEDDEEFTVRENTVTKQLEFFYTPMGVKNNLKISISGIDANFSMLPIHTKQTFRVIMKSVYENKTPEFVMPLKEFMEKRGYTNENRARKEIISDLNTLQHTTVSFDVKGRNGVSETFDYTLLSVKGNIKSGFVYAGFNERLYTTLKQLLDTDNGVFITQKSDILDRISFEKSSLGYTLGELIEEYLGHQSYNKNDNYKLNTYFIMSVRNILSKCKELPTKEELIAQNPKKPRLNEKIITPLENALEKLCNEGMFTEWTYCHAKGKPLDDDELGIEGDIDDNIDELELEQITLSNKNKYYANYDEWKKLYIKIPFPATYYREEHDKTKTRAYKIEQEQKKAKKKSSRKKSSQ